MSLTVITRAPKFQLIGLAKVRDRLLDGDGSEDALLQALIDEASAAMVSFVFGPGANFARQAYSENLAGTDRRRLTLARLPVDPESVVVTIDSTVLDTTTWSVEDAAAGILYRLTGWGYRYKAPGEDSQQYINVTYKAGWILPDMLQTWATGLTLAVGAWIKPTSPEKTPLLMEVTTGGVTSGSEPTWPTTAGDTVAGAGGEIYTARTAFEFPVDLEALCYVEVFHRYSAIKREPYLGQLDAEGVRTVWTSPAAGRHSEIHDLAPAVQRGLARISDVRVA